MFHESTLLHVNPSSNTVNNADVQQVYENLQTYSLTHDLSSIEEYTDQDIYAYALDTPKLSGDHLAKNNVNTKFFFDHEFSKFFLLNDTKNGFNKTCLK